MATKQRIIEQGRITGLGIVLVTSMILIFFLLTFDREMALIYMMMLVTYYVWWKNDSNITLPVEKTSNGRVLSLAYAALFFVAFLGISSFASSISPNSVIQILGTTTPVFAGNKIFTIVAWGILIPIIESVLFFGIFFEGMAHYAGRFMRMGPISTKFDLKNMYLWGVILAIGGIFVLYHVQSKGVHNSVILMVTFLFSVISCWMVSYYGQTREAIMLHMFTNLTAVLASMNLLPFFTA